MNKNRFSLQPYKGRITRHECPLCHGQQCFTRYIDVEGIIDFPNWVGRCDHENKCGYHYSPKQYFDDNPETKKLLGDNRAKVSKVTHISKPVVEPYFFNADLMDKSENGYEGNALCSFLSQRIDPDRVIEQMKLYHAGTTKSGATAFWQVDVAGRIRDCKIIVYDKSNGRRSKDPQHHVQWLHSQMRIDKERIQQCFFGEHLIGTDATMSKPIAIVESEKSAIVSSLYLPDFIWIATGGKDGMFGVANYDALRGHKVILVPDLGMYGNWQDKAMTLVRHGVDAITYDFIENNASEEDKNQGLDIADFLLQQSAAK